MAITGTQISERVGILLQDTSKIRWTDSERLLWINDGRREMATLKPDVFGNGTEVTHTLTAGCKQRLTNTGAYKLISIDSNVTSGKAIRPASQAQLDAFRPGWRNDSASDVQNWFPDTTDPIAFWVYPASTGGVKAHAYITPTDLTDLSQTALPFDQYEVSLVNYICFRAYSKEDEAGAAEKAVAYYNLFTAALK